jgi:predicted ATP-grasp superfamily ATP-dependent carboligase
VLDRDGAVAAQFQERVTRTWPREAGTFAATVGVEPDERLVEAARAMLADAGYWGLAQLDLVETGRGTLLLDVNPRFYFCMPLALRSGVNLPAAWHAVVEGRAAGPPARYRAGRRYRWLEGDLYAARHGELGRLRPGRPSDAHTMWAADDPLASALLALDAVARPLRRRRAERRARS